MTERTPTAQRYEAELREIAGMLAQAPDGQLRWKQYRLTAIADYIATTTPAPDAVAEGLTMIPRQPTEEMMAAGLYHSSAGATYADVDAIWKGMFDAIALDATRAALSPDPAGKPIAEGEEG